MNLDGTIRESRRRMIRRSCAWALVWAGGGVATHSNAEDTPTADCDALARGARFMWSRQAADGGWHSDTYALLRSGQALTPVVLHALLQVPEASYPRPKQGVQRALDFIRKHVNQDGALGLADPDIAEYPNYATAYALCCLLSVGRPEDQSLLSRMRQRLVSAQYCQRNGFTRSSPAFGGWGFDAPLKAGAPGHMDLGHTRRVLQALRDARAEADVLRRAEVFLGMVQRHPDDGRRQPVPPNDQQPQTASGISSAGDDRHATYDGGFYFSPVVLAANKGRFGGDPPRWHSYATATCDGILALLAAGVDRDEPRVVKAVAWLKAQPRLDYPQGVPTDHPEPWGEAIRYYHFAVRADVYQQLDWPGDWRRKLQRIVAAGQRDDGSFVNEASGLMKEDDPLMCTALAMNALAACAQ